MLKNKFKMGLGLFLLSAFVFCGVEEELKKINEKLDTIGSRLTNLEKKVASQPAAPQQQKKQAQADPNKVYDVPISNSVVLGNPEAKVTVIKWTDFQ